jgi:hypothetical protein
MVGGRRPAAFLDEYFRCVFAGLQQSDTHLVRVPKQAIGLTMDDGYEVSATFSGSTDLREIC